MFEDIAIEELLKLQQKGDVTLIDVRSPSEFMDATIPGSVNIPLFDDRERAEIGTIYKQQSKAAANDKGLEIVSAKLPDFIKAIGRTGGGQKAVFCWRGGMRSKTSATLASLMGYRMLRLVGGYRAYRTWVVETLGSMQSLPPCYCINGYTGSGKTTLLRRLEALGYPTVNIEGMACHRGSIFGHIGMTQSNQKAFESRLVHRLIELKDAPYLIMEAESKRIGKVQLPELIAEAKADGETFFVHIPFWQRVAHILEEYNPAEHHDDILQAYKRIEKRIHTPIAAGIREALLQGNYEAAVSMLLENYYDPRYEHAISQYVSHSTAIEADSLDDALEQLVQALPDPWPRS